MPPITISSTSVLVITASPAIAPPRPSEPVSPMKIAAGNELNQRNPTHAPTRQARQQRQVAPGRRCAGDERHRRVGEQHDRGAARGQPVEAVGEVDAVRRAREHQEDQHRVEQAEVDRGVDDAQVERVRRGRTYSVATSQSPIAITRLHEQLGPARDAERAALARSSSSRRRSRAPRHRERRAEHGQAGRAVSDRIRNGTRSARRITSPPIVGVPALSWWPAGPLLADVLAELVLAQELDELRPEEHADEQRAPCPPIRISPSMPTPSTRSRPDRARALTSTRSPGRRRAPRAARPPPRRRRPGAPRRSKPSA